MQNKSNSHVSKLFRSIFLLCSSGLLFISSAHALTINVTTTEDNITNNLINECLWGLGPCSLREAVIVANYVQGTDTISIPKGTYLLSLESDDLDNNGGGDLDILESVNFVGSGPDTLITGDKKDEDDNIISSTRIFHVLSGDVSIARMTLTSNADVKGSVLANDLEADIDIDDIVFMNNSIILYDIDVINCRKNNSSLIYSDGDQSLLSDTTSIVNSRFTNNITGGVLDIEGSDTLIANSKFDENWGTTLGLFRPNNLEIKDSVFTNNKGAGTVIWAYLDYIYPADEDINFKISNTRISRNFNPAIDIEISIVNDFNFEITDSVLENNNDNLNVNVKNAGNASFVIRNSTFDGATSDGLGTGANGVYISAGNDGPVNVDVTNSTLSNNRHLGLAVVDRNSFYDQINVNVINSTISGNGEAGAVFGSEPNQYNQDNTRETFVDIIHSTITNNGTVNLDKGYTSSGIFAGRYSTINLYNTIIAKQVNKVDCGGHQYGDFKIVTQKGNLDSDRTCQLSPLTDLVGVDPLLGPLQNNGGPTRTHYLSYNSPAIDAGIAIKGIDADQRGFARPQGNNVDIGAYEIFLLKPIPCNGC